MERRQVEQTFLSRSGRPVVILGERRVGKTSLQQVTARRLAAHEDGRLVPLFLPPVLAIRSLDDYAREIVQRFCSYLNVPLAETGLLDEENRFRLRSFGYVADTIERLRQQAPDKTFILCVDEFDVILITCARPEANKILGMTDFIIERTGPALTLYLTMTRLPEAVRDAFHSPGISKSEVIDLGPFSRPEMEEMVTGLLGAHADVTGDGLTTFFRYSGGHPYFVKLLLDRVLAHYGQPGDPGDPLTVTGAMIEAIVPAGARDLRVNHALDNIYKVHFNRHEKAVALLLAEHQDSLSPSMMDGLGAPYRRAAKALARRGYLTHRDDAYDFRIRFLGDWLRHWEEYEEELERLEVDALRQHLDVDIKINRTTRQVTVEGDPVKATAREYQMLVLLCEHPGELVTKDQMVNRLWPEAAGDVTDAALDAAVYRLRNKLGDDARNPRYLETVTGQGFILRRATFVDTSDGDP